MKRERVKKNEHRGRLPPSQGSRRPRQLVYLESLLCVYKYKLQVSFTNDTEEIFDPTGNVKSLYLKSWICNHQRQIPEKNGQFDNIGGSAEALSYGL